MSSDDKPSDVPEQKKGPGTFTMMTRATEMAEQKAEDRRTKEIARDKEQEEGKEKWAERALTTAEKRAEVSESQVNSLHRRYGFIIFILVIAIIGMAGYRVAGNFLKGELNIGGAEKKVESAEQG
jgi:hypothetical protein